MILAVVNQKGGTGKTTTTVNVGSALAIKGKKVLLIDLDAQGNLSYSLGIQGKGKTMSDVFLGETAIDDILIEREGMSIAPADIGLADAELTLSGAGNREYLLRDALRKMRHRFDYVLIDCPPALSLLTVNALSASDHVLIPMQLEVLSLQGLDLITETIRKTRQSLNPALSILGILPVMIDQRRKLTSEILAHIQENYEVSVFNTRIRNNVKASEAPSFGSSVIAYAPGRIAQETT